MEQVLLLDSSQIRGGMLRRVENMGKSPRVGDECEVLLSDTVSKFGRVVNVYYLDRLYFDVEVCDG